MVKIFACSVCDKTFRRNEHLARHERTHTGEKPFHCPRIHLGCNKRFSRKDQVLRHLRRKHREVEPLVLTETDLLVLHHGPEALGFRNPIDGGMFQQQHTSSNPGQLSPPISPQTDNKLNINTNTFTIPSSPAAFSSITPSTSQGAEFLFSIKDSVNTTQQPQKQQQQQQHLLTASTTVGNGLLPSPIVSSHEFKLSPYMSDYNPMQGSHTPNMDNNNNNNNNGSSSGSTSPFPRSPQMVDYTSPPQQSNLLSPSSIRHMPGFINTTAITTHRGSISSTTSSQSPYSPTNTPTTTLLVTPNTSNNVGASRVRNNSFPRVIDYKPLPKQDYVAAAAASGYNGGGNSGVNGFKSAERILEEILSISN